MLGDTVPVTVTLPDGETVMDAEEQALTVCVADVETDTVEVEKLEADGDSDGDSVPVPDIDCVPDTVDDGDTDAVTVPLAVTVTEILLEPHDEGLTEELVVCVCVTEPEVVVVCVTDPELVGVWALTPARDKAEKATK
jgi:hypothetical protein